MGINSLEKLVQWQYNSGPSSRGKKVKAFVHISNSELYVHKALLLCSSIESSAASFWNFSLERGLFLTAFKTVLIGFEMFTGNQGLKLKQLVSSGESMTPELLKNLQRVLHDTRILNLYGCTEAAGDSLCFDATKFHTESGLLRYLRLWL